MTAAVYDITVEEGATFRFPKFQFGTLKVDAGGVPILDPDGNQQIDVPRDFTGCKFRVQIRKRQRPDAEILTTLTSEDTDGGITGDAQGNVVIVLPDEKADLVNSNGYWDLKCYNPDQTEDRLVEGSVSVNRAVTVDAAP
jgi:hypothetical protein